jgi:hypothetical protein
MLGEDLHHRGTPYDRRVSHEIFDFGVPAQASFHWRGKNSLTGVTVTEPARLGGQKVVDVPQITTQQSLLEILRGRPFEVVVSSPWVDYSPVDGTPRLQRLIEVRPACFCSVHARPVPQSNAAVAGHLLH